MISKVNRGEADPMTTYVGLSTDEKPTDAPINSIFFALNTGDMYYWTGETWAKVGG